MAEDTVFGSTGRMTMGGLGRIPGGGTKNLDRTLDSAEKMFERFTESLSKILGMLSTASSGAHRATSQSSNPILNGGFSAPTTQPNIQGGPAPTWSRVGGNWAVGSGSTPGMPSPTWSWQAGSPSEGSIAVPNGGANSLTTGGGGGGVPGGRHRAPSTNGGNFGGKAFGLAAVGLAAFTANHYDNQTLEQSIASQYAYGSDFSGAAAAMFKNNYTAFSPQDAAGATNVQATMGGYRPGSAQFAAQRTANESISYADPTISNTQAAQAAVSFQNPSTFNRLQVLGINPINSQGIVDIHQLAIQILNKVPWYRQIKTAEQIQAELYDPAGGIYVTLQSFLANGLIPAKSIKSVTAAIGDILRAQIKGVGPQQLSQLEAGADRNDPASKALLNQLGIGNSLAQTAKARIGESMNTEVETLGGFTAAVKASTGALVGFRGFLNSFLSTTHTGGILGGASGVMGTLGGVFKVGAGYLAGRGVLGALRGGGGILGRAGGAVLSRGASALGWAGSRALSNINPFNGPAPGSGSGVSPGESSGNLLEDIAAAAEAAAKAAGEGGIPAGGMAPFMSAGAYSSSQIRGIGSSGAHRGGRSFGSGGMEAGQSKKGGSASNNASSGTGGAGVSFIAPGPGADSLDGETDFGPRNIGQGFHTGIDIMRGMQGATMKASADGQVTGAGWGSSGDSGYGNTVMIDHGGGYVTMYAHCATITVNKGASVRQGQGIASVGGTGSYARGPHLHFELHINGKPVDPVPYIGGKRGTYKGAPPGGAGSGSSGQTQTSQGTGSDMGSSAAFANGNKYGSTEEVDALASIIAGNASISSSPHTTATGSGSSGSRSGSFSGSSGYPGGGIKGGGLSPDQAKSAARKLLGTYGWTMDQFSYLDKLWTRESGWRWNAENPSSGAYGIPQSLPADKMAAAGSDWRTNAVTQERWGLGYIRDRYHSPAGAWAHSEATGWYDKGSWEIKKDQLAVVHQGELIAPRKDADVIRDALTKGAGSGASINFQPGAVVVQLSGPVSQQDADQAGRMIVDAVTRDTRLHQLTTGALYGQ